MATKRRRRTRRRAARPTVTRRATAVVYRRRRRGLSAGPGRGIKGALNLGLKAGIGGVAGGMVVGLLPNITGNPQQDNIIKGALIIAGGFLVGTQMKQPIVGAGMAAIGAPLVVSALLPAGSMPGLSQGPQWVNPLSQGNGVPALAW